MRADGDARLEAEASKLALQRVQQLLVQAAQRVCPAHAFVFELPKDAVRRSAAASAGGDLQCRAVSTIWRKLVAGARGAAVVRVETVSEFGLKRETDYTSAADLARAVLAQLPEGSREVVADARVLEEDGSLQLSTQLHMRRMRAAGMLHCAAHRAPYEEATEAVHAARGALVCRWLVAQGCDADAPTRDGTTPLHWAAAIKGRRAVCEWLLSPEGGGLGEQHLRADGDGNTPARMARAEGFEELADYLEERQRELATPPAAMEKRGEG
ncbi:hypothetical protein EMIHUDRAFT_465727 [Emiliania huxleyi CCMP1516]|uniref:ANK_REP_REGION domain-containing protein n=2 Tax=Emiliania huxleyi TaxID=2903 RepID=A0A0D3I8Y2_EMIH1|nr:hypothetical protein EMIHUDRAFT_465727 [Emiliania huxleyi CCMP1516]EOD07717.1 hypothetical protein EMIHUDRAFT_465727 [Emiliania huxleyi CCMP1516]|eukprot:XP_005760146.1 hypothetical protein EMIHUDRAFT_465727 [Emiliania huxleyi CCMP1516]